MPTSGAAALRVVAVPPSPAGSVPLSTHVRAAAEKAARLILETWFFRVRHRRLTEHLATSIAPDSHVLDVGSSCGRLAASLRDASGCRIQGVDVHLQSKSYIEVNRYDGTTLPHDDDSFDSVLMVDMLHHVEDIDRMMSEARRVARRHILIKDHYWRSRLDWWVLKQSDLFGNVPYGIQLRYNYLTPGGWRDLFRRHNLRVRRFSRVHLHPFDPCLHVVMHLDVV